MTFTASLAQIVEHNENGLLSAHLSWQRVRLAEVAQVLNGFPFPSAQFAKEGGKPLIRIRDILASETETYFKGEYDPQFLIEPGDLIVGMDGDFNCTLWQGRRALLNQRVCKLSPNESFYRKKFLAYALPGYLRAINAETPSVTVKHLSSNTVADIPLPLPPLAEQDRIIAEIEKQFTRLDAGFAALKRFQANLKRYRAAVLKAAVEGRIVRTEAELARREGRTYETAAELLQRILAERRARWEAAQLAKFRSSGKPPKDDTWKQKYKEPIGPNSMDLPQPPEGWVYATAEQCTSMITDGEHITPERSDSGVLLLSARNILDGRLSLDEVDYVPEAVFERLEKRLSIEAGDVLLSCSGSVGRSCVAPEGVRFALVRSVAVLKPLFDMGHYLSFAIRSEGVQSQISSKKTQTAQSNIFQGKIKTLVFPLPPLDEQLRIVVEVERRLSIIEELGMQVEADLKRAERLRQAILKRAFEGKLVPQDPDDEPASVLLERIRAEREANAGASRKANKRSRTGAVRTVEV